MAVPTCSASFFLLFPAEGFLFSPPSLLLEFSLFFFEKHNQLKHEMGKNGSKPSSKRYFGGFWLGCEWQHSSPAWHGFLFVFQRVTNWAITWRSTWGSLEVWETKFLLCTWLNAVNSLFKFLCSKSFQKCYLAKWAPASRWNIQHQIGGRLWFSQWPIAWYQDHEIE